MNVKRKRLLITILLILLAYGVLPAWGVSDTDKIKHMTIDGQCVDHVIEFLQSGTTYYLWIIDDLQTEHNAVDIEIDDYGTGMS